MNQLEYRIRRGLHAAGERIPESPLVASGKPPSVKPRRSLRGPLAGIAAMVAMLFVVGSVSLLFRGPVDGNAVSRPPDDLGPGLGTSDLSTDTTAPSQGSIVEGTVVNGSAGSCSPTVARGILYLGGPASQNNLAANGFIFSLPAGPTAADFATTFVSSAVVGDGCEQQITASTESDLGQGRSAVGVDLIPPATRADLRLTVDIASEDDVVGITEVRGATSFDVVTREDAPAMLLLDVLPQEAASLTVKFRKGEDVWELSVSADEPQIALAVPPSETDPFSDAEAQWVLFTVLDRDGALLDVGGALIP